ncbi:hypothetical protein HMPREF0298_2032 [Corynebacterium lipophiloflavum DSM 44291]|uniref:Uncharacterized protein n=1 Tax=Corynebacterium lipophiloflavum (strain ATCC 700352 / DSM 44291 / CCUG 37336 / JCM 10383 / DMMZ 1944) TaxID=525263 RepID=C0XUB2_CORLD|nr:hypothetical protein HMPREF0298_2032 [Corynebacterium lipophiloflavum DSM 44291]
MFVTHAQQNTWTFESASVGRKLGVGLRTSPVAAKGSMMPRILRG